MKKAAIDIGSNSVRMLIGEVKEGKVYVLEQHLRTTRLGKTAKGGYLNNQAVGRTLDVLVEFKAVLEKYNLQSNPITVATSAVREAADKEDFRRLIKTSLGWNLQILSGEDEARFSYIGAAAVIKENAAVVDVGGGSTELIYSENGKIYGQSVPVGAVRLHNGEVNKNEFIRMLQPLKNLYAKSEEPLVLVGVGGTVTSVAAMKNNLTEYTREAVNGTVITEGDLQSFYTEISAMSDYEVLKKYPLLKNREDIICDGILIYMAIFQLLGCKRIIAADSGILDGLLLGK